MKQNNKDYLGIQIGSGQREIYVVVVVYWDVKGYERNRKISARIKDLIKGKERCVVARDFNAQLEENRKNWNGGL